MKKQTVLHETIFVDFKTRTVMRRESEKIKMTVKKASKKISYNFSNFNEIPEDSNFIDFSDQARLEYSNHILAHIHEATFADLVHWANHGMIDMKKVNEVLKLDRPLKNPKRKK